MGIRNELRSEPARGREEALVVLARHLATSTPTRPLGTLGLGAGPERFEQRATGLRRLAILGNHLPRR